MISEIAVPDLNFPGTDQPVAKPIPLLDAATEKPRDVAGIKRNAGMAA